MHGESTNPVLLGETLVVKLYGPYWCGPDSHRLESEAYRVLNETDLPVPRVLARGTLRSRADGWPWPFLVLSRVEGRAWRTGADADRARTLALAGEVGELLARFRAVPLPVEGPLSPADGAFEAMLRQRHAEAIAEHREWGYLSPVLLDQLSDRLPEPETLIGATPPVFVHGDLHGANLFTDQQRARLTGIVDFNDVYAGDEHYSLVQLHLDTFGGDRELLATALDRANWPITADFPERMLHYTMLHDFEVFEHFPHDLRGITDPAELAETLWGLD